MAEVAMLASKLFYKEEVYGMLHFRKLFFVEALVFGIYSSLQRRIGREIAEKVVKIDRKC